MNDGTSALADAFTYLNDPLSWSGSRGILALLGDHLWMTLVAVLLAAALALPIGLWLGRAGRGGSVVVAAANLTRALPTLALLYLFTAGIGLGQWPTILAVAIFAVPPILSNTWTGLREVDPAARDAGRGMGMSSGRLLLSVELPLALPLIGAGLRTAVVQVVATVSLAALAAGGGLGVIITNGIFTQRYGQALAGALLVVLVCLGLEGILAAVQRVLTPAPMRQSGPSRRPHGRRGASVVGA
ncbi:ABC transporter permease [Georgenia subflava]|uniref:ABC transporter permease subunit n=1 Tax=Georgenia subflava TaxID=1622177 RepID=A0A6N7EDY0_9MICO|nr:ABC transporter permease subunit [Georgenia subflava]MPV36622.1 ABC transporter permease subunit [Georgenia subflava]